MKKLIYLFVALSLLLALVPATTFAHTEDDPFVTDLIAGGGNEASAMDVGDVLVWNDGDMLYVKYLITDPEWCITETHLQVFLDNVDFTDVPNKNGNPIPGKFEFNDEHDCVFGVLYTYDLAERGWSMDDVLYFAAHAVVQSFVGYEDPNLDNFAAALPDQVTMSVQYPYGGGPAYFPVTTVTGGTVLDGTYEGWCVDTDNVIYQSTNYTANVYSSYETLPEGLVEYPENLDLVNWIINQGYVGQSSACDGTYTYGDVQRAIWALIEDGQSTSGLGSWSQCRVDEILAAAYANGEGFTPGCDDYVAVILQPVDGQQVISIAQVTFASVGVPCSPLFEYETAWGAGFDFPGKNWATYLGYTVQGEMPEEWPEGGTITVAFEDLPLTGSLDYDYNDWVVDIETLATFWGTSTDRDLTSMEFTIIPEARGAGYNHVFHILIPADTFGCGGTYTLVLFDGVGGVVGTGSGTFDATVDNDFPVIPDTTQALPGTLTNTIEPTGIVSHYPTISNTDPNAPQHQPYVPPQRTATLSIDFGAGCPFDFAAYDPYSGFHGEGLFFDPYLHVNNTGNNIHEGDARMLTVPVDWMWPEAGVGIWLAYTDVTQVNPPTFAADWWLSYNDLVYNGKP